jgi:hypothetical protein
LIPSFGGEKTVFSMVLRSLDVHRQRNEVVLLAYNTYKKLHWIKDLNRRAEAIKLLEENRQKVL